MEIDEQTVNVALRFADPGFADTHMCQFDWDDGSAIETVNATGPSCNASHTYKGVGIFTLTVIVTDVDGGSDTATATAEIFESFPLKVVKAGTGSGTVKSAPGGISCKTDCTQTYS